MNQDTPFLIAIIIAQDPFASNVGFEWGYAYFQSHPSFGFNENEFDASFDYDNWFGAYAMHEREDAEYDQQNQATFAHIGTHCHEMFHVIGWGLPNVLLEGEDIWSDMGSNDWTLMSTGYRTGPLRKTESPGDLDPAARVALEWADPTPISSNLDNESIQYIEEDNNIYANFDFYQFDDPYSSAEFLVENRQYSGFNSYLPEWWKAGAEGGLLIWRWQVQTSPYYNVADRFLIPADNNNNVVLEGMPHVSGGDLGDPFPGETNNTAVTPYTTPSTNSSSGFTGFAVTDISSSATTMSADLWADFPPDKPKNLDISNPGEDGEHPILEWDANTEPDLDHYLVWRGWTPNWKTTFPTWEQNPAASVTGTTWTDNLTLIDLDVLSATYYRLTAVDEADNESDYSGQTMTTSGQQAKSSVEEPLISSLPRRITLQPNYPNPCNPQTKIGFALPEPAQVRLSIYNVLGEEVRVLTDAFWQAGYHDLIWDGRDTNGVQTSSGVYIYKMEVDKPTADAGKATLIRKLTLMR